MAPLDFKPSAEDNQVNRAAGSGVFAGGLFGGRNIPSDISATAGSMPTGTVAGWLKNYPNTPALPSGWVECNGQVLNDSESVYHTQTLPNLNASTFLIGSLTSGGTGGASTHKHRRGTADAVTGLSDGAYWTDIQSSLPPYYAVVWIMKVK